MDSHHGTLLSSRTAGTHAPVSSVIEQGVLIGEVFVILDSFLACSDGEDVSGVGVSGADSVSVSLAYSGVG